MAQWYNARQLSNAAEEKKAILSIPSWVWDIYKDDIQDLYVGTSRTLEDIRQHLRLKHSFDASYVARPVPK